MGDDGSVGVAVAMSTAEVAVPAPHLPPDLPRPVEPRGVVPLDLDLGVCAGHRLLLRSLELWHGWADLRFARIDEGAPRPLPRRVPPVDAWRVRADDAPLEVLDAVGRGDREFSNGEVRLRPAPPAGSRLEVRVELVSGEPPLSGRVLLPCSSPDGADHDRGAPMATGLERLVTRARERGLEVTPTRFPEGTRTAVDAANAIGCDVAQIVKSLVFVADGRPVLVLTSGANRVAPDRVAARLGAAEVRQATAEEVRAATGFAIGGTPPLGHDTPLEVLCDRDLTRHAQVWAAAGTADSVFPIAPDRLIEVSGATVADVAEDP